MAVTKQLYYLPRDAALPYIRVSKIVRLDETARDAEFNFHAFASKESAAKPGVVGDQVGVMRFQQGAFDAYFSKAVLSAPGAPNPYAQAYIAAKDWTAANLRRRSGLHDTDLTPAELTLIHGAFVSGPFGESLFVGASDV